MKTDDFFETLSDIDDELIANARPVRSPDEVVVRRAPLWKTVAGYAAAAACVAALAVGGIFGIKYFNGRNAVTPPASGTSDDVLYSKSDCMAYTPMEYPAEAKYVYKGDYGELDYIEYVLIDISKYYSSYEELAAASDLVVSGEFTDHAHQTSPVDEACRNSHEMSYNTFYIKDILKGDKEPGEPIVIGQHSSVHNGEIFSYPMAPMVCGDKWIYFLKEADGYYMPVSCVQGRYPLPFNRNKELKKCGDYGYYYGSNCRENDPGTSTIYLQTLNEFGLAVTQDFDGVILSVMTDKSSYKQGDDIKVTATVLNTTDKPIGLWMPVQGEGSHTEISTRISRGKYSLSDVSVAGWSFDDVTSSCLVKQGVEYVQEMVFSTFTGFASDHAEAYESGEYKGTASIRLLSDPDDTMSDITERLVEFSLTIEGKSADNERTDIKKVFDRYSGAKTALWAMDEFPGVTFSCDGDVVSVLTEGVKDENGNELYAKQGLYSGMPIKDIYLADLNNDGKREIISTVVWGSGITDAHIEAYDLANNIHYTLWDRCNYNYSLKLDDGRLIVEKHKYNEWDVMTEQTLSLDMLYGEKLEMLVTSIPDKASGGWVMEEFPGVTFYAGYLGISAEKNGVKTALYKDVIVYNVVLCDLNGDGKREIISQIKKNSVGTHGVRVYDYANGVCYEYWSDYMNYMLSSYEGKLTINVRTEDYLSSISEFDLRKPDEHEIVIPADKPEGLILPVITWTSLSDFHLENVNKNDYEFVYAIGTIKDEPIYSTVNGEVVAAAVGNTINYGSYIIILGEDGLYYYFCNLSDNGMYVSAGDKVTAGQKIAVPGDIKKWLSTYEQAGFKFIRSNKLLDMTNGD